VEEGYINVYGLDITERKQADERIKQQKQLLEITLESLTHPFYVVNADNYIIEIANSAAGMSEKTADAKCYELTHKIGKPCSGTKHLCPLKEVKKSKKAVTVEHIHYSVDGKKMNVEVHGFPVLDKEGNVTLMITYYLDITERKQLDQMKDEFIGLVSHELRSPLTVITGAVNTVLTEGPRLSAEETKQLLLDASHEADSLAGLLNNLLELSRAQAGRLFIRAELVNFKKVLRDSVEEIRRQSSAHRFVLEIPGKLPVVTADKLRLERILNNLLENAVKYSPNGGEICVSVKLEKERLVISVSDQGIGISKIDQAKLFKPFQRLEDTRIHSTKGLGLGLLVCQRLVESHGGQIWVESKPGQGSTFFFTLPLNTQ
jgi:signal transduction histidine kinase